MGGEELLSRGLASEGLVAIPYELSYISTACPNCGCTISIPSVTPSWYLSTCSWACPKCGQLCEIRSGKVYWREDSVILAVNANKFFEQRVFIVQERLDKLLKRHNNLGIRLFSGSRTGLSNDLIVMQIFSTRDCGGDSIWGAAEDDMETLLIKLGQQIGLIEDLIEEKDDNG